MWLYKLPDVIKPETSKLRERQFDSKEYMGKKIKKILGLPQARTRAETERAFYSAVICIFHVKLYNYPI